MNIFVLDPAPQVAARNLCDKHVVKMIVESAQMMSTAHRVLDGEPTTRVTKTGRNVKHWDHSNQMLCLATMVHHPCTQWVMRTNKNYLWLYQHASAMLMEYNLRYHKIHAMEKLISVHLSSCPKNIPLGDLTPFAQAMPDKYRSEDAVTAYRNYYLGDKARFAKWKNVQAPNWWIEGVQIGE